jgi:carboxyl-terminal processing protease
MKPIFKNILFLFLAVFSLQSCEDNDDKAAPADIQVNNFVWRGLNEFYLWQADVPNLADDRFANEQALNSFLRDYSKPEDLFQSLLNRPVSQYPNDPIDRFSWIVDDYTVLEQELNGIAKNTGVDFRLERVSKTSNDLVGYVRYIIPNSDASAKSDQIKRGDLFTSVNGQKLTVSNYEALLLDSDGYTLNLSSFNGNTVVPTGKSVTLTKTTLEENPVLISKVISKGNHEIGYLMYNGFYNNFDDALNVAFGDLKTKGITDLVLDLRYNGGGDVHSSTLLASMITGQFPGDVFSKRQYNAKFMSYFSEEDLESVIERFATETRSGQTINGLGLNTVYVITTRSTASASELVINGLKPYVNVIQIGDTTIGKNVGSFTIYDSETYFNKQGINRNHKYAMQPLTFRITNKNDFGDYTQGLSPAIENIRTEAVKTYGVLGNESEPLLRLAISRITGVPEPVEKKQNETIKALPYFGDSKSLRRFGNEMYTDKAPRALLKTKK